VHFSERGLCWWALRGVCVIVWWPNTGFQSGIGISSTSPPCLGSLCDQRTYDLVPKIVLFFLFLFKFHVKPSNFLKQLFNLFFFKFSSCSLDYNLFYLKSFIKLKLFFNFILSFFSSIIFNHHSFVSIFFNFLISSLILFFHLIFIPDLVLVLLITTFIFYSFLDFFIFFIPSIIVLFHLNFILDLFLIFLLLFFF
jgi:hypothetical protein